MLLINKSPSDRLIKLDAYTEGSNKPNSPKSKGKGNTYEIKRKNNRAAVNKANPFLKLNRATASTLT